MPTRRAAVKGCTIKGEHLSPQNKGKEQPEEKLIRQSDGKRRYSFLYIRSGNQMRRIRRDSFGKKTLGKSKNSLLNR